ncbi:bifunctional glutamate-cysteine ligase/glutathione synthetase GshF [Methanobrevibacter ruminantium M1]|uniref:glutamate--cysteine ligase n=1 Tax=Methanobrevibacter ruminantium (strain ATCC 35063 / DSM 1093 / JCM 13430 / OCM 146 / M1) TaxID=634498 RepID=D3E133_METRM|nr:glutamate--cysteine ligase [Methanobrevibacter ruminantium]ADC46316.1 bifunctional glutamate-cysteine ligase/glutathione synthetase GshF [Methanobrevibacter ruminantium M1]
MDKIFNLSQIKNNLSSEQLKEGSFGIEWECLRVKENGELSLSPHPEIFGDKLTNPYITTDFSESQIEIITPAFDTIDEAFSFFSFMSDLVNSSLSDDEYLWFQSLPCILPESDKIPIAKYKGRGLGEESMEYRKGLAKKYGLKKQLISGIHFNFSFKEELIESFYDGVIGDKEKISYKEFKDSLYLKISRNYIRYVWLIIYLTGCSVAVHNSFTLDCQKLMNHKDNQGSVYSDRGPSFRNSSCGYKNLEHLYPSYASVEEFTRDIQSFIDNGHLSEAKELYTQIRLKPRNPSDLLGSLNNNGIQYLEIRTLDINPFYKCGLIKNDMNFLHMFMIYLLIKEESDYESWQEDALYNEEKTAECGYEDGVKLIKDGKEVVLKDWALSILDEMEMMVESLNLENKSVIELMKLKIINSDLTYGRRLARLVEKDGYIESQLKLSRNNKLRSKYLVEETNLLNDERFKEYVPIALQGLSK